MKFEHVLKIYWTKGFLFNNTLQPFSTPLINLFSQTNLLNISTHQLIVSRFEITNFVTNRKTSLHGFDSLNLEALNIFFSQFSSVNGKLRDLQKLIFIRLYLIKTVRGRSHALGKPSRGQRTWSNSWTAYNYNKVTRTFINDFQKTLDKNKLSFKINYKLPKKKQKIGKKKIRLVTKTKSSNTWF